MSLPRHGVFLVQNTMIHPVGKSYIRRM